jgi:hypothetical protein
VEKADADANITKLMVSEAEDVEGDNMGFKSVMGKEITGVIGYSIAEPFIDSLASRFSMGLPTNLIQLGVGYFLRSKKGIIGTVGQTMFTINLYQLIKGLMGGSGLLGVISGQQTNGNGW